jgi:sec-independent protein translocase protein TatB
MFNIGGGEMVFLAILALLVFGPEGLPEIVKTVTRTVRAFRQAANDFQSEVNSALTLETQKREVAQRRRNRALPAEQQVQVPAASDAAAEEGLAESPAVSEQAPEADLPEAPSPADADRATPETPPEGSSAENEPPADDDDGPGIPMAKPVRLVPDAEVAATDLSQPGTSSAVPESAL